MQAANFVEYGPPFDPREQFVEFRSPPPLTPDSVDRARRASAEEAIRVEHADVRRLNGLEAVKVLVAEFGPKAVHGWLYLAAALDGKDLPCKTAQEGL